MIALCSLRERHPCRHRCFQIPVGQASKCFEQHTDAQVLGANRMYGSCQYTNGFTATGACCIAAAWWRWQAGYWTSTTHKGYDTLHKRLSVCQESRATCVWFATRDSQVMRCVASCGGGAGEGGMCFMWSTSCAVYTNKHKESWKQVHAILTITWCISAAYLGW